VDYGGGDNKEEREEKKIGVGRGYVCRIDGWP
jgi:hypothetical protein